MSIAFSRLNGCTQKVGCTSRHSLHSGPAAVQNFRSVHPCPRLFGEGVEHKECSLRCWLPDECDGLGLGRGRWRSGTSCAQRLHTRSQVAAPTPVITLEANSASCARALAPCRLKFLAKLTRSLGVDGFDGHGAGCLARELMATLHVDGVPDDEDAAPSVG